MAGKTQETARKRGALRDALVALKTRPALSLPYLDETTTAQLVVASRELDYRPARPLVGAPGHEVEQDFVLAFNFPAPSPFHALMAALDADIRAAAQDMEEGLLPRDFHLNDLIVQRYPQGCKGITPHRDHIRYQGLVAIITLAGEGRFGICNDRSARDAQFLNTPPGSLNLMRAPGFCGARERPFHFLDQVIEERISLGLRWDTRPNDPS